jgi:hypothetical protein
MTCSLIMSNNTLLYRALALIFFISASLFSYAQETTYSGIEFTGMFGGTIYDGISYTSPTGSEPWGGFANEDVSIYPLSFVDGGEITFTGATTGTDADVYFRFEYNPYPDTEPSFNTTSVTVSGVDASPYSVVIPSQGTNTFSSFLLYVTTLDASVSLTDVSVTATFSSTDVYGCTNPAADNYDASATIDDGSCSFASSALTITTTVCNSATSVRITGPWWGWDPNAGPAAVDNGDDTWTFTLDPAPTADMEYLLVVDGVQESLIQSMVDGGSCAPITDYANYANRLWVLNSGDVANVFGTCGECATGDVPGCTDPAADNYNPNANTDDGTCTYPSLVNITLSVNTANITVGPNGMFAGGGVLGDAMAVSLSDPSGTGTWTGVVTLNAGTTGNYIFLNSPANGGDWGTKEDLTGQSCADPANWNDRILPAITSDITLLHCFGSCESDGSCPDLGVSGCTDPAADNYNADATSDDGSCTYPPVILTITTTVCNSATSVRMTGPWWGWDPNAGPAAVDNGDDTWTFTLDPAPTADMEYLLVVDGVQESLIQSMVDGGSCAPITDYANYANRLWVLNSGDVANVFGTCGECETGVVLGCMYTNADNYNSLANDDDGSCIFPPTSTCIGDLDGDNVSGTSDLLALLANFGSVCP